MGETKTSRHLAAGFIGGLTSAVALQPLDLIKTRIQQTPKTTIRSIFKSIKSPLELWRGTVPSGLRTSVGSALYLSMLNISRTQMAKYSSSSSLEIKTGGGSSKLPKLSVWENMITGVIARASIGIITMPITIIKVRFESNLYQYKSILGATNAIYSNEGLKGFFRGVGPTCLRDAPYAGLYVSFYEHLKVSLPLFFKIKDSNNTGILSMSSSALINSTSAVIASVLATGVTAPFDTIKTNMQLNPKLYKDFTSTTVLLLKEDWKRFFDGLSLRLLRKAGSASIAWCIYEELVKL